MCVEAEKEMEREQGNVKLKDFQFMNKMRGKWQLWARKMAGKGKRNVLGKQTRKRKRTGK